jgi:hypothetical protein
MPKRKTIPQEDQNHVLISSARRCCLCYGLHGDLGRKDGQIAHLDHNPSNPDPDNLAWLCFDHHNEYDSSQRQGKGLTIQEVKTYRARLYDAIAAEKHTLQGAPKGATKPKTRMTPKQRQATKSGIPTLLTPVPLVPGIGNAYLSNLYLTPPTGKVHLDSITFQIPTDSLIFDTNAQIRYYLPEADGSKEIDLPLSMVVSNVRKVHFLINSGNSKNVYANQKIGEIRLLFGNIHPISTDLILGNNIREWAVGNQGDYVRELRSPATRMAWQGMNKQGVNAVMDHLEIAIPEAIQSAVLEKIVFVHKPTHHATDSLGVQYIVMAITVESSV